MERAIARLKIFKILSFIKHDLYPYINKILVILAYTVNSFGWENYFKSSFLLQFYIVVLGSDNSLLQVKSSNEKNFWL